MNVAVCATTSFILILSYLTSNALGYGGGLRTGRSGRVSLEVVTEPVVHAEGPHWDHEQALLYYVDISSSAVLRLNATSGEVTRFVVPPGDKPVSIAIPVQGSADEIVVTRGLEVAILDVITGNVTRVITHVEDDKPGNRFNDGKADPRGRLWAGTMGPEDKTSGVKAGQGSLYILGDDLTMHHKVTGIDVSNGLAWNEDGSLMYYIDTGTKRVDVFDYNIETGNISNRRVAFDFTANNITGFPDSMTIDTNDTLWVACWSGYQVVRIDPINGVLLSVIVLPVKDVTSVTWGGSSLDELYVTTSKRDLSEEEIIEQPLAGCVFKITGLGAQGRPSSPVNLLGKLKQ